MILSIIKMGVIKATFGDISSERMLNPLIKSKFPTLSIKVA